MSHDTESVKLFLSPFHRCRMLPVGAIWGYAGCCAGSDFSAGDASVANRNRSFQSSIRRLPIRACQPPPALRFRPLGSSAPDSLEAAQSSSGETNAPSWIFHHLSASIPAWLVNHFSFQRRVVVGRNRVTIGGLHESAGPAKNGPSVGYA
jgi:hypothetical protein